MIFFFSILPVKSQAPFPVMLLLLQKAHLRYNLLLTIPFPLTVVLGPFIPLLIHFPTSSTSSNSWAKKMTWPPGFCWLPPNCWSPSPTLVKAFPSLGSWHSTLPLPSLISISLTSPTSIPLKTLHDVIYCLLATSSFTQNSYTWLTISLFIPTSKILIWINAISAFSISIPSCYELLKQQTAVQMYDLLVLPQFYFIHLYLRWKERPLESQVANCGVCATTDHLSATNSPFKYMLCGNRCNCFKNFSVKVSMMLNLLSREG